MRKALRLLVPLLAVAACDLADPGAPGNLVPRTVAEDPSLPAIDLAGSRFHAETFGSPANPPIIFLHGGPGGDYRGMLRLRESPGQPRLEDDFFLVFWDQRGAGLSQRHDAADIDLATYLADLDALIDYYAGDRRPLLVGHSWGGMYATAYVDQHPDRVAGLVLLEPGPLTGALFEEIKGELIQIDITSEWTNDFAWAQRFLSADDHARMDYQPLSAAEHAQPAYHLSQTDPEPLWRLGAVAQLALMRESMPGGTASWDFTTSVKGFAGPVHLVASSDNTLIGRAFQERQAAFFAAPVLSTVAGGHDFPWTNPAATVAVIRQAAAAVEVQP